MTYRSRFYAATVSLSSAFAMVLLSACAPSDRQFIGAALVFLLCAAVLGAGGFAVVKLVQRAGKDGDDG